MAFKKRIYYHDTDCGGVVYYANYLKYLEEARTQFFEERGVPITEFKARGVVFVVARQEIDYVSPAFYGNTLQIDTWITEISKVRVNFEYTVKNQDSRVVATAKTVLIFVDTGLKPKSIPADIKTRLT